MTGVDNGVVTQLKRDYPRVKAIHCVAHKLELSVKDALKAVTSTNHFEIFITKLYTLYHQSHKNQRELEKAAANVQETLRKITPIFTIRWVASSFRAVKAVWHDFAALLSASGGFAHPDPRPGALPLDPGFQPYSYCMFKEKDYID